MQLLQTLESEHRRIDAVNRALEAFAHQLAGTPGDLHELIRFMTFIRGYVDGYHHEREETVLLPALVTAGFDAEVGPIAHLRDQHREEARLLLRFEMTAAVRTPWDASSLRAITDAALAIVAFSRTHMAKEQSLLFPAAEKELQTAVYAAEVEKLLRRFELRRAPRWDVSWLEQLGDQLASSHGQVSAGA